MGTNQTMLKCDVETHRTKLFFEHTGAVTNSARGHHFGLCVNQYFLHDFYVSASSEGSGGSHMRYMYICKYLDITNWLQYIIGPRRNNTCLRGSSQSETQTSLLSYRD